MEQAEPLTRHVLGRERQHRHLQRDSLFVSRAMHQNPFPKSEK